MPRWLGVLALLAIAATFGANHVAARLAFDHGVNVTTAVAVRSIGTALFVLVLLRLSRVSIRIPTLTLRRGLAIGLLVSVQSWCLYSAVARIPVALALLVFNTFPIMLGVISWLAGGERPARRTLIAMPVALLGLAIALDVAGFGASGGATGGADSRSAAGGAAATGADGFVTMLPGVAFALTGSAAFGLALHLTSRWLPEIDGRLRTLMFMIVVAAAASAGGAFVTGFDWPRDAAGWTGLSLLTVLYGMAITGLFVVLPRLGAVNNAAIMNFEPVAALGMAWAVLGQTIAPIQLAGGVVVIAAILYLSAGRH
jgi:drug/metabolite transporter (DMT)-like permease